MRSTHHRRGHRHYQHNNHNQLKAPLLSKCHMLKCFLWLRMKRSCHNESLHFLSLRDLYFILRLQIQYAKTKELKPEKSGVPEVRICSTGPDKNKHSEECRLRRGLKT